MKMPFVILIVLLSNTPLLTQTVTPHYNTTDHQDYDPAILEYDDCINQSKKIQKGKEIIEFEARPLFNHISPNFQKWSKKKYLIQADAHIYQVDDTPFLIIDICINSTNAKRSYGDLERSAKMKLYLDNKEFIYIENLEKNRGKLNRSDESTHYTCVLPLERSDKKALQKNYLTKLGVMWEEAYQEYEIQNIDLIKNQLNCLNK